MKLCGLREKWQILDETFFTQSFGLLARKLVEADFLRVPAVVVDEALPLDAAAVDARVRVEAVPVVRAAKVEVRKCVILLLEQSTELSDWLKAVT